MSKVGKAGSDSVAPRLFQCDLPRHDLTIVASAHCTTLKRSDGSLAPATNRENFAVCTSCRCAAVSLAFSHQPAPLLKSRHTAKHDG